MVKGTEGPVSLWRDGFRGCTTPGLVRSVLCGRALLPGVAGRTGTIPALRRRGGVTERSGFGTVCGESLRLTFRVTGVHAWSACRKANLCPRSGWRLAR